MIKRFTPPTNLTVEPIMTEWHYEKEDGYVEIYIQINVINQDNERPCWVRLGDLFEQVWLNKPGWWVKQKITLEDFVPHYFFVRNTSSKD